MKILDRVKELRRVRASELLANPKNWRQHPDAQRRALRGVLEEIGYAGALLVRETPEGLMLIDGHLRAETTPDQDVPVLVLDVTEKEAEVLLATIDPLAAMAGRNDEALAELLAGVADGIDPSNVALSDFLATLGGDQNHRSFAGDPEETPAASDHAFAQRGDLILMGEHRLLCGDSMNPGDVSRATAGEKWDVAVIDPPFEMDSLPHLSDPSIVFGQAKHLRMIPQELWRFERVIDKVTAHRSATVQIGHRHAFVAQCGTVKKLPDGPETYPSVVVAAERPDHPHQKPLALLTEHLTVWTPPWEIVFDPFLGSGTTLIAAESLGRKCYGLEMDPRFCDVIVQRWQTLTGKTAEGWRGNDPLTP